MRRDLGVSERSHARILLPAPSSFISHRPLQHPRPLSHPLLFFCLVQLLSTSPSSPPPLPNVSRLKKPVGTPRDGRGHFNKLKSYSNTPLTSTTMLLRRSRLTDGALLAASLSLFLPNALAQSAGSFVDAGNTLVSAMMVGVSF